MIRTRKGRARGLVAMAVAAAVAFTLPLHAGATSVYAGAGTAAISFSAPSGTIDLLSCSHQQLGVTGTGAVAISMLGENYAGPVTFSGSADYCGIDGALSTSLVDMVIEGDALFGQLNCGTTAEPAVGVMITIGPVVQMVFAGVCTINGHTGFDEDVLAVGAQAPTGVSTDPAGVSSLTFTLGLAFDPVVIQ